MQFILGEKQGMSQYFDQQGNVIPVTVIEAGPCFVTQVKKKEKDNYQAVQVGFKKNHKKNQKSYKYLTEFLVSSSTSKQGDKITADIFKKGDQIKVSGTSKGKGFQGVVKRHGFSGGPASHGHRHVLRTPGSIGSAYPQRVVKGKKMPGHTGNKKLTISGLKIVKVDPKNNIIAIKGSVPGPNGRLVKIVGNNE